MRDRAARGRTGVTAQSSPSTSADPRIHVDLAHLRGLEGPARSLRLLPRQPAGSILSGRHHSRLRGRGLNFEELRDYLPGDDVRSIDWKVTARTGKAHVRVFTEERDRPTLILVDQRMTMFFGSQLNMKSVTAAEAATIAAFAVLEQSDRVGGVVFGDELIAEFLPRRSQNTLESFIGAIANANGALSADTPTVTPMSLNRPLEAAARIARSNSLVLVISDFDGIDDTTEVILGGLRRHNDVVLFLVTDPIAHDIGRFKMVISDGELQAELDTASGSARKSLSEFAKGRFERVLSWERKLGIPVLPLSSGEETPGQLRRLLGLAEEVR